MGEPVVIGNDQIKFVKDANSKQMTLWTKDTSYMSAESGAGTYQVPLGKKFIILQVRVMRQQTHLNTPIIFETASSGAATGTIIFNAPVIPPSYSASALKKSVPSPTTKFTCSSKPLICSVCNNGVLIFCLSILCEVIDVPLSK